VQLKFQRIEQLDLCRPARPARINSLAGSQPAPLGSLGLLPRRTRFVQLTFYHLTTVAAVAVLVVLVLGLANLLRGRSPNLSQKLMRWRVGLQFLAIIIIMITFYLTH
jgi:hypothetical protein